jgi:hypothetical protein
MTPNKERLEIAKQAGILIGLLAAIGFVCWSLSVVSSLSTSLVELVKEHRIDPLALRLLLSSTGLFIAVAFAALGFGLFLIGAQGDFEVQGPAESKLPSLRTSAPGLAMMVCATFVVYLALKVSFEVTQKGTGSGDLDQAPSVSSAPEVDLGAVTQFLDKSEP